MTEDFIDQSIIYSNWREWELVHQHKAMSNYLLALHYSDLILRERKRIMPNFNVSLQMVLIFSEINYKRRAGPAKKSKEVL